MPVAGVSSFVWPWCHGKEPSPGPLDECSWASSWAGADAPALRQAWYHAEHMPEEVKNTVEHQHEL